MEDVPQPAPDTYERGDRVRIYLTDADPDARFHGAVCEVIENQPDDLGEETGRDIDSHHYRLRKLRTGDELDVAFRHNDLVPLTEWPVDNSP